MRRLSGLPRNGVQLSSGALPRSSILAKGVRKVQEVLAKVVIVPLRIVLDIWRNRCRKASERIADERLAVRVFDYSG